MCISLRYVAAAPARLVAAPDRLLYAPQREGMRRVHSTALRRTRLHVQPNGPEIIQVIHQIPLMKVVMACFSARTIYRQSLP